METVSAPGAALMSVFGGFFIMGMALLAGVIAVRRRRNHADSLDQ